jgi:hypothetical protein
MIRYETQVLFNGLIGRICFSASIVPRFAIHSLRVKQNAVAATPADRRSCLSNPLKQSMEKKTFPNASCCKCRRLVFNLLL